MKLERLGGLTKMFRVNQLRSHLSGLTTIDESSGIVAQQNDADLAGSSIPIQLAPRRFVRVPQNVTPQTRVVVLCGWAGGKLKYLENYDALYRERSFVVFYVLADNSPLVNTDKRARENIDFWNPIVDQINRLGIDCFGENPSTDIVLHLFSNTGVVQVWKLSLALQDYEAKLGNFNFSCMILDSGPGIMSLKTGLIFTMAIMTGSTKPGTFEYRLKSLLGLLAFVGVLVPATLVATVWRAIGFDTASFFQRNNEVLYSERFKTIPRLFMHSKTDRLVEFDAVEFHKKRSRVAGSRLVRDVVWENAEHVKLRMSEPDRYTQSILSFMKEVESLAR
ncbi:hypothetical protein BJ742DRAFT_858269 [Cladochytrium replicatum]|nr:hypothetical protein BJ742DRAFT_858269 [Cladochytrium replicatum]